MRTNKKFSVVLLALFMVFASIFNISYAAEPTEIQQVNIHVGREQENSRNITWITNEQKPSTIIVNDTSGNEVYKETIEGREKVNYVSKGWFDREDKIIYSYQAEVKGLNPNTEYTYEIKNDDSSFTGNFRTSLAKNEDGKIRFILTADPQVNGFGDAKGASSNFYYIGEDSKRNPLDFIYIAGDHTNNKGDEMQWDLLFNGNGRYKDSNQEVFKSNTIISTQGNHDSKDLDGHINAPGLGDGKYDSIVYSSNIGNVKFIVLNNAPYPKEVSELENNEEFQKAIEFLRAEAADAKANGMWTILGFHKPLYTGASHMKDNDMRVYRKILNPIINEIGVDMVLTGHDHVYTRMFIDKNGNNATEKLDEINGNPVLTGKEDAPFHFVGGHGGGLKWYRTTDYPTLEGDPLLPNYEFADKNSAQEEPPSADLREQTYTVFEIDGDTAHITAYTSKYNDDESLQKAPQVYDEFYIRRKTPELNVKFEIAEDSKDFARFIDNASTAIKVKKGSVIESDLIPSIEVKDGYRIVWEPSIDTPVRNDMTFIARIEKMDRPVDPTPTPEFPSPIRPDNNRRYNPFVSGFFFGNRATSNKVKPVEPKNIEITDITGHWAEKSVREVVNKGYMELENGKFFPNVDATRLEYVKALAKLAKVNPKDYMNKTVFKDVKSGTTDAGYINWANEKGIIKGTGEGDFEGDRNITRQEIATILNRYEKAMNLNLSKKDAVDFSDNDKIADWAKEDVKEAHEKGIFNGKDNNMFDPLSNITRAEVAQVVVNMDR